MLIGIGGISRAGKTTLAENMTKALKKMKKSVEVFCQDDFVKPKHALTKIEGVPDWERPNTVKWDSLISKVEKSTADVVIVEGLFSFYPASIRSLYDKKLFLEIDENTFQNRKSADKRWTEEPGWYARHVWRSYNKYGKTKGNKEEYIFLDGSQPIDVKKLLETLMA
ncbi:uridine kinase [Marinoscillum sp. MHG1-6]|uniref:uridine kinase family protein n=1 Tax=Marinoscillum sp. MHG1-6 TaxID=2959627 RepID=UPI0021577F13|nr:hypothetical protein [Marinoscillum sp. MHG1-6]